MSTATVRGAIRGMDHRANPAFAVGVVAVPAVALAYALTLAPVVTTATVAFVSHRTPDRTTSCDQVCEQSQTLLYVHVMAGPADGHRPLHGPRLGPVLGGLQGLFRLAIVVVMVYLRWPAA